MIVKFIVTAESVYFGKRFYKHDEHKDIANTFCVPHQDVLGGGLADLEAKRIYGTSKSFGRYDVNSVKKMLPSDWQVDEPSNEPSKY